MNGKKEISKAFSKQARDYEQAAKVQQEIGSRLFERLQYLKISPQRILDLGCGPGTYTKELALMYPDAHIVGVDLAQGMLLQAQTKLEIEHQCSLISADAHHLPFNSGSFDLVFSNQVVHWLYPLNLVFRELNRVMNVNACLMFSTLGPDTFNELKYAWQDVDAFAHTNDFLDMHDVGDALMAEYFVEPVMDMEPLAIHYASLNDLVHSLKVQGVKNTNNRRNPGLTGKRNWAQFCNNYEQLKTENGKYPLSYEVVYGHAWKGVKRNTSGGVETLIPVSKIIRA